MKIVIGNKTKDVHPVYAKRLIEAKKATLPETKPKGRPKKDSE